MSDTLDLTDIPRKCGAPASIEKISLTAMANVNRYSPVPEILDTAKVFSIYFRSGTSEYSEKSNRTSAGQYIFQSLTFFTPGRRFDIDYLIQQLLNNTCGVVYKPYDGNTDVMLHARMEYEYTTGTKLTDRNGTSFRFTTTTKDKSKLRNLPYLEEPVVETDGPFDLPTFTGPFTRQTSTTSQNSVDRSPPGSTPNNFPSYFVKIEPGQVNYLPSQAGNVLHLNKFITASDGMNYFIDYLGNAMQFASFPKFHQKFTPSEFNGNSVTVTMANLPDDPLFVWVFQNGRKKEFTTDELDVETYSRDGQVLTFYRLTSNSEIHIYWGGGHSYNSFSITQSHYQHFESDDFNDNTVTITVGTLPSDSLKIMPFQNGRLKSLTTGDPSQENFSRNGQTLSFYNLTETSKLDVYFSHSLTGNYQHFEFNQFDGDSVVVTLGMLPDNTNSLMVFENGRLKHSVVDVLDVDSYSRNGQTLTFYKLTENSKLDVYW